MDPTPISPKPPLPKLTPAAGAGAPSAGGQVLGKPFLGRREPPSGPARLGPGVSEAGKAPSARPILVSLSWTDEDIENRWGIFRGGRYTSVNRIMAFLL